MKALGYLMALALAAVHLMLLGFVCRLVWEVVLFGWGILG